MRDTSREEQIGTKKSWVSLDSLMKKDRIKWSEFVEAMKVIGKADEEELNEVSMVDSKGRRIFYFIATVGLGVIGWLLYKLLGI